MRTLSMMMVMVAAACGGGSKATTASGPAPSKDSCTATPWDTLPTEEVDAGCSSCAAACLDMAMRAYAGADPEGDEAAWAEAEAAVASYAERACTLGDGLGCLYAADGYMAKVDEATALSLFVRSCELLDPEGCWMLGSFSESGYLMEENAEAALGYYRKACEHGAERRLIEGWPKNRIDEACEKAGMP